MSRNRLSDETSPYLLQHQDNPVHWWPWGPEALAEAKSSGKPILLSVGYAACHWCHVMAHESFEDEATARVMNDLFVNIKVDREERPDIDAIYMGALHSLGEHGGWPLTMFLDSEARPFWGGTYFPKEERFGKPSFTRVLREVARIHAEEPEKIQNNARVIIDAIQPSATLTPGPQLGDDHLRQATVQLLTVVDPVNGGLKGAPKFPQYSFHALLWRGGIRYDMPAACDAVELTLTRICQGGIYDHIGGGFARYAVDERWLVPHFEKMLYDNALLVELMTEVWRETRNPLLQVRIDETVKWLGREMVADGGAFAASLDADSEGEEGKFYVWSAAEIADVLGGEDAAYFCSIYDVTRAGNWEGTNILNRLSQPVLGSEADEARLAGMRQRLLQRRDGRIRPGWDDKVLADWNGMMIAALARASAVFERPDWLAMAERAFAFVCDRMSDGDRLIHSFRLIRSSAPANASDYANMIWAALRLYEVTGGKSYVDHAIAWTAVLDRHYWVEPGGYATAADDTSDVIVRMRMANDDAVPNANAVMCSNLVALSLLTGSSAYFERAERLYSAFAAIVARALVGHTGLIASRMDLLSPQQVALVGDTEEAADMRRALFSQSLPGAVHSLAPIEAPEGTALAGKKAVDGKPTGYACVGPQCSLPITEPVTLSTELRGLRMAQQRFT